MRKTQHEKIPTERHEIWISEDGHVWRIGTSIPNLDGIPSRVRGYAAAGFKIRVAHVTRLVEKTATKSRAASHKSTGAEK